MVTRVPSKFIVFLALATILPVQAQTFSSGPEQVALIELYTSEGCSSCPPADRWLSSSRHDPKLWRQFVPIALHVDYWDRLGWRDIYADAEHSARQRQYAQIYQEPTVYTPGLRLNGDEWRGWRSASSLAQGKHENVGSLELAVAPNLQFEAQWTPARNEARLPTGLSGGGAEEPIITIAVLGMGVESNVLMGENAGRTLKHDFVVLSLNQYSLSNQGVAIGRLARPKLSVDLTVVSNYAVAAWVSHRSTIKPIQSVGGYLDYEF